MMYYLLLAIFYPISLLPLWMSYRISDFAYLIIYHVMGYRKEIVRDNLVHAFPTKSPTEIDRIQKAFYRAFCDQWIETIHLLSMSKSALRKRVKGNWDIFSQLTDEGRNVFLLSTHNFNWDWAQATMALEAKVKLGGVYLPLSNKAFDRLIYKIRSRTGTFLISMKALLGGLKQMREGQYIIGLLADQNPSDVSVAEWIPFMHREVPVFRGPEMLPRRSGAAVVFGAMRKLKRGYYEAQIQLLTVDASKLGPGEVLKPYIKFIEDQLEQQPENYLWSHRRWKHKRVV